MNSGKSSLRRIIKSMLNSFCLVLAFPFALSTWLEKEFSEEGEIMFSLWAHLFAIIPGLPGILLRRGFYRLALDNCSPNCCIGFGTVFTHRQVAIEDNVSIGLYAVIGCAHIDKNCEIASRVSMVSGKHQHDKGKSEKWSAFDHSRMRQIYIAPNVWIGEGAVIMADIGEGSMVGAGSVVTKDVPANVVVAGNPAKVLKEVS